MTIESGSWGFGRWGAAVFGFKTFGVPCSGNFVNQALMNAIMQTQGTGLQVSASVFVDGVDRSSALESLQVKNTTLGGAKTATLVFIGSSVTGLTLRSSLVEIFFSYVIGSDTFTACLFSGTARSQKLKSGNSPSVELQLFDLSRELDEHAPTDTGYTGSSLELIRSELAILGYDTVESVWTDYTYSPAGSSPGAIWTTVRAMINDIVSGVSLGFAFLDSAGIFRIYDALTVPLASWAVPKTAQFSNEKNYVNGYNRVIATNNAGLSQTYNDTDHQTDNGILETTINAPYCRTNGQLLTFATKYAEQSQSAEYSIDMVPIPFLEIGDLLIVDYESVSILGRIQEMNLSFSWPAGPSFNIVVKEIPTLPEIPSVHTAIYDYIRTRPNGYDWIMSGMSTNFNLHFTVAGDTTIAEISILKFREVGTPTCKIINTVTAAEFGPFALTKETLFDNSVWTYDAGAGFVIPAGTYEVTDTNPFSTVLWAYVAKGLDGLIFAVCSVSRVMEA